MREIESLPINNEVPVKYGTFNARMIASAIDMFIISMITFPVTDLFLPPFSSDIFAPAITPENVEDWHKLAAALMKIVLANGLIGKAILQNSIQFFFIALYILGFWFWCNNTPGKIFLRLEIRDNTTLQLMTRKQAIIRFLSYIISFTPFSLGFIWVLFNKKRQAWHDKIANTIVVVKPKKVKLAQAETGIK